MSKGPEDWGREEEPEVISKTTIKREMHALQVIGETLVALSPKDLKKIPIENEELVETISLARNVTAHGGKKRLLQYIGKLMRKIDPEPIIRALRDLQDGQKEAAQHFHNLEILRDKLVAEGPGGIESIIELYPLADRQHLRQLVLQAKREEKQLKPPAASRKIFKYIRELDEQA